MVDKATIDPALNGGQSKGNNLECGCDPNNAERDSQGTVAVFKVKDNVDFFAPFGSPAGMRMVICAQCKEIIGFQVIEPPTAPADPLIVLPS